MRAAAAGTTGGATGQGQVAGPAEIAGQDPAPFPWGSALHAGLCLLRLDPEMFWALSPREFAAMTGAFAPRRSHPQRAELTALMARYPDEA